MCGIYGFVTLPAYLLRCVCFFYSVPQSQDRSNGGPTQRASALAALNSAFSSSSGPKTPSRTPGQGSQRAAAVAALSSVLTAEKKKTPEGSPSATPPPGTSPHGKKAKKLS